MAQQSPAAQRHYRRRPALQVCECCLQHRRVERVVVRGVAFIVCDECAQLAPFDAAIAPDGAA